MSDSDAVTMNIPNTNPLYKWVLENSHGGPIQHAMVIVGNMTAKLALTEVAETRTVWDEDAFPPRYTTYLETSWRLLRDNT